MSDPVALKAYQLARITRGAPILGALGNSWVARGITSQAFGAKHPVVAAASILKDRVRVPFNALQGTSGATSTTILGLLPALIASGAKIVWIEAFINDADGPALTLAQMVANMRAIADTLYANGIVAIFQTIPPRGDAKNTAALRQQNYSFNDLLWAEYYARPRGTFFVVDAASIFASRSSSVGTNASGFYDTDNVHLIDYGAWQLATAIAAIVDKLVPSATPNFALRSNTFDRTNYKTGWLNGSASFFGTGGTISATGSTGTLAAGWTLARTSGSTIQAVASKVTGINGGEYQRLVLSSSAAGATQEQLELSFSVAGVAQVGDVVRGVVDAVATGLTKVTSIYVYVNGTATGVWTGMGNSGVNGDTLPAALDRLARTPDVPVLATETLVFKIVINANCTANDVAGTIDLRYGGILAVSVP